jgi:hypothetical protein
LANPVLRNLQFLDAGLRNEIDDKAVCAIARCLHFKDEDISAIAIEWRHYQVSNDVRCMMNWKFQ